MSLEFSTLRTKPSDSAAVVAASPDVVSPENALSSATSTDFFSEGSLHWFPMRIRNASISRMEKMLERLKDQEGICETYAPLGFIRVSMTKMDFAPILLNYIFVRATFARLVEAKQNRVLFEPLRFVMHPVFDANFERHVEPLFISDKRMEDYKRLTAEVNSKVIFLENLDYACKPSQEVQITEGEFTGVIGRIKRIKGKRCVVLPIGREIAPAIVDVPRKSLRYLTPPLRNL